MRVLRNADYIARRSVARKARNRAVIDLARQRPCADCGLVEPAIMQFDHVPERGGKAFCVSFGGRDNMGIGRLLAEIAKCDIVCPNCHARRTNARAADGTGK